MTSFCKFSALLLLCVLPQLLTAQKYFTRDARVYFDATSKNSPERVEATNKSGTLVMDMATGKLEASVLMKGFLFEKALMQEHFNENYVESTKFPKATFKGKIDDPSKLNLAKDGTYTVPISGDLTLHGVTKAVKTTATFVVKGGSIAASAAFMALLADYGISIPSLVADKLGKEAKVSISGSLTKM
jgi:polyisoprenoid-binding protein YceI